MYKEGMLKENTFKDKVVLITGGGTGLGKSMGTYLLSLGAKIIITSRKIDVLDKTKEELEKEYPNNIFAIASDVRKIEDVENVINESYNHFGKVDYLINNAAGNFISPTERLSAKAWGSRKKKSFDYLRLRKTSGAAQEIRGEGKNWKEHI